MVAMSSKKGSLLIICVIISLVGIGIAVEEEVNLETLRLVQVIVRHGERTPVKAYPTDPYNETNTWPEGWGQLTQVGKKQMYEVGIYLRTRYDGFISDDFVSKELTVLSSAAERTIMSAELVVAGLFPTPNGTEWNPDLHWQPVPFTTLPAELDNMIGYKQTCPKYEVELDDYLTNSPELKKIKHENRELFDYVSEFSGVNVRNINLLDRFYDTLMVEEMLGKKIPEWAVSVINTPNFQYLYNLSFASSSGTARLKRLRAGPLIGTWVENIQSKVSNSSFHLKMFLISGHDLTLITVLNGMEVLDLQRPYYGSSLFLELHQHPVSRKHFVRLYLRNQTDRAAYKLQLPLCELDCPLEIFLNFTKPIIPKDWVEECKLIDHPGFFGF